jgi:mono/diheme cytochrome c family protein
MVFEPRFDRFAALALLIAIPAVAGAARDSGPDSRHSQTPPTFAADVQPIFEASCVQCHGGVDEDGEEQLEGLLNLTTYEGLMMGSEFGSVVEPGDSEESVLVDMVKSGDMPEEGDPLTAEQIDVISGWIDAGAENN